MTDRHIHRVLNGETDAFRYIIRQYRDEAYTLAVSLVKDEFTARDVVQSSFIQAWSRLSTFRGRSKFSTWLYRIVYNEAMQVLRKQKRRGELFQPAGGQEEVGTVFPGSEEPFEREMEEDHRRYWVNEALSRIPPKEALALRLFYQMDHTIREITGVTGWSVSAAKVTLHRGREHMKQVLTHDYNMNREDLYR